MLQNSPFQKRPECDRCHFYSRDSHLHCAIHPQGGTGECFDFRHDPAAESQHQAFLEWEREMWEPKGASYYNGELILQSKSSLSAQEQEELLDWHPLFTGRCPECEMPILAQDSPQVHWDCGNCGWKDDTV
ncbi:hypothetical protein ACQ4M4_11175 [Leptolyngbya sp. AN02str]|uniref:hypothetical protein n=1 Tax=Leptolyngbya sp. AN02str TaxID=3423363 RepID=UPI003D30F93A